MKAQQLSNKLSIEEYVQHEIDTNQKYEFHDGVIYALAGGSIKHALLVGNTYAELRNALKAASAPCKAITSEAITSEAKLHISTDNIELGAL